MQDSSPVLLSTCTIENNEINDEKKFILPKTRLKKSASFKLSANKFLSRDSSFSSNGDQAPVDASFQASPPVDALPPQQALYGSAYYRRQQLKPSQSSEPAPSRHSDRESSDHPKVEIDMKKAAQELEDLVNSIHVPQAPAKSPKKLRNAVTREREEKAREAATKEMGPTLTLILTLTLTLGTEGRFGTKQGSRK